MGGRDGRRGGGKEEWGEGGREMKSEERDRDRGSRGKEKGRE